MDWNEPLRYYCERGDSGLWAEPFNALTNLAFLVAAVAALLAWRRSARGDLPTLLLVLFTFAIALGSFLFHMVAVRWAWLADATPIALFIAVYLLLSLTRFLKLGLVASILGFVLFEAVTVLLLGLFPPDFLNRSVGYLPALLTLAAIGGLLWHRDQATARALLLAAALFALSLAFRIADLAVCGSVPFGTHFLWHVLNACALYVLVRAAISERAARLV
jgi:hypothetical protein